MRRRLSAREQSVLRDLAEQLRRDDPDLAAQLETPLVPALDRYSPLRWTATVYLTIGIGLLVPGAPLHVGSAIGGGVTCLGIAFFRVPSLRRQLRTLATWPGWVGVRGG